MHARVTISPIPPDKIDEAIAIYRDSIVPAARQVQGFRGGLLLTDRNAGKVINVGLWETEADMKAGETSGYYQENRAKLSHLVAGTYVREVYEVSDQW
jgi:heme-degrading monooxygenase HmoA